MPNSIRQSMTRRDFLKFAGIAVGLSAAACYGLGAVATIQPKIDLTENHLEGKKSQRILVTYASKAGSTGEVAQAIGEALAKQGATVDVYPLEAVTRLEGYQAAVVGSAVRQARWVPAATKFVETNRSVLSQMPTAFFTCGMTLYEETEENRRKTLGFMDTVSRLVTPVAVGAFAGKMDYNKLSFFDRTMVKMIGVPEGDFRQWEAIRTWASSLQLA